MKNLIRKNMSLEAFYTNPFANKYRMSLLPGLNDERRAMLKMVLYLIALLLTLPIITGFLFIWFEMK